MRRVVRVVAELPEGFAELRAQADAEGFRNLARLAHDWQSGAERFENPAALFAAYDEGRLAGVGGVTRDPVDPAALRVRRFYVQPGFRRRGLGEALVRAVLDASRGSLLLVHSSEYAMRFWDDVGFARSTRPGITHERTP